MIRAQLLEPSVVLHLGLVELFHLKLNVDLLLRRLEPVVCRIRPLHLRLMRPLEAFGFHLLVELDELAEVLLVLVHEVFAVVVAEPAALEVETLERGHGLFEHFFHARDLCLDSGQASRLSPVSNGANAE